MTYQDRKNAQIAKLNYYKMTGDDSVLNKEMKHFSSYQSIDQMISYLENTDGIYEEDGNPWFSLYW